MTYNPNGVQIRNQRETFRVRDGEKIIVQNLELGRFKVTHRRRVMLESGDREWITVSVVEYVGLRSCKDAALLWQREYLKEIQAHATID